MDTGCFAALAGCGNKTTDGAAQKGTETLEEATETPVAEEAPVLSLDEIDRTKHINIDYA